MITNGDANQGVRRTLQIYTELWHERAGGCGPKKKL
jgi:hypothetical protein